ncbi:MAG: dephospho-CoA kinase [Pirellulaceae bacterium]|nr:dephospho-CoA kinase [Pirellulaceae bacterium]
MTDLMPSRLSRPVVIGLVGGIASGKSYVGSLLESLGAKRIDADRLGHEVLMKKDIRERLTQIWGPSILTEQGEIDRAKVGKLVFGDSFNAVAQRKQLEAIVLPRIRSLALEQMSALRSLPVLPLAIVIDAPLLIEAGWEPLCDFILFIDSPLEERLARAAARGWTESHFAAREASQISIDEKRSRATHIFDNSCQADIAQQVNRFWHELERHVPKT